MLKLILAGGSVDNGDRLLQFGVLPVFAAEDPLHKSNVLATSEDRMMDDAEKTRLRAILQAEFAKHRWDTFVDERPEHRFLGSRLTNGAARNLIGVY